MRENIRILLADDHRGARTNLAALLRHQPNLEVVGEASDGRRAVELAKELLPDVVIMDVRMPELSGIEATRIIVSNHPKVRVIGFSMFSGIQIDAAMQGAGAVVCISKSEPIDVLIDAIHACCS